MKNSIRENCFWDLRIWKSANTRNLKSNWCKLFIFKNKLPYNRWRFIQVSSNRSKTSFKIYSNSCLISKHFQCLIRKIIFTGKSSYYCWQIKMFFFLIFILATLIPRHINKFYKYFLIHCGGKTYRNVLPVPVYHWLFTTNGYYYFILAFFAY